MTTPEPDPPVSEEARDEFRATMSRLASGVCVVAVRERHQDLAMTATSLVSVSLDPPTVLFTVHSDARLREAVEPGSRWAVSILGSGALAAADWLATPGRPAFDQLATVAHHRGDLSGAAILDDASAWLECETQWIRPAATHDVVVGRVLASARVPGSGGAVLHFHGRMTTIP
ncbi:flavin reductase family protein [Occultella aeris]|uniref:4-hydroxyphenylacetate 3-monooxygenase reductase component n=1 Tax=Occultella aeris TaxID=2761496 RepID=A0A7M4DIR1_9MICO|nr:flavin reductase family protein [Occultella aeris]VZO36874.1 4-hydroxyphenylacetate 3-monooxygenase reductase component [Occultella aeris]